MIYCKRSEGKVLRILFRSGMKLLCMFSLTSKFLAWKDYDWIQSQNPILVWFLESCKGAHSFKLRTQSNSLSLELSVCLVGRTLINLSKLSWRLWAAMHKKVLASQSFILMIMFSERWQRLACINRQKVGGAVYFLLALICLLFDLVKMTARANISITLMLCFLQRNWSLFPWQSGVNMSYAKLEKEQKRPP